MTTQNRKHPPQEAAAGAVECGPEMGSGVRDPRSLTAPVASLPRSPRGSGQRQRFGLITPDQPEIGSGVGFIAAAVRPPSLRVFFPWLAPSLNKVWAGMHWAKRNKIAREGHLIVKTKLRGAPKLRPPVMLTFQPVHPRGRRFDALNYALSAKIIEDGLVRAGLLGDDSGAYVLAVVLLCARRGPEAGVWLEVVEVDQ